jgi:hypothetical protein
VDAADLRITVIIRAAIAIVTTDRRPCAHSTLAAIPGRAGTAIVAGRSVGLGGVRAHARGRITCARGMALVHGGADDRV